VDFYLYFYCMKLRRTSLIYSDRNLSDVSYLCCVHSTVHATVLYSSRSRRSSLTKLSDRVTFLRTTKYCVAGMLFSLFDVSLRSWVCLYAFYRTMGHFLISTIVLFRHDLVPRHTSVSYYPFLSHHIAPNLSHTILFHPMDSADYYY
jgi:hypothetical protein